MPVPGKKHLRADCKKIDTNYENVSIDFFFANHYTENEPNLERVVPVQTFDFTGKLAIVTSGGGEIRYEA
ncbi:hypothetical protein BIZ35_14980 [Heyndrickxia coagulans]|nr:hypothetical protein BIZ35_14980 [Heyndrickxia coagulans]AVD54837.1 hypothetical protein C3766_00970 [Heyndrickxia coagulans]RGR79081.1 hypothetical protein DWY22_14265 [Heyndrickxia coagulans]RGR98447.1 hypothetical protein DWY16_07445 [Heyndrickxia coagulans]WNE61768.1 hypothetical protein KIY57_00990 [Heyndrickxia coagulans]